MKALWFENRLELRQVPDHQPGPDQALIKVQYAGICNTDLEITRGYMKYTGIPGHEFVGQVVDCRQKEWLGKRVTAEINQACGTCLICRQGLYRHCPHRTTMGIDRSPGAMAEYAMAPVANLHLVPQDISDKAAVFVEPLAAAYRIIEQQALNPQDRVLVLGDGKLGQLVARALKKHCRSLSVVGKHRKKLELLEAQGINTVLLDELDHRGLDPVHKYDMVVEATGNPDGFLLAMKTVRPCGKIILKSTYALEMNLNPAPLVVDEIQVIGSRCGPFPMALKALQQKEVQVEDLVSDIMPLSQAVQAFEKASQAGVIKILLDCTR